MQMSSTWLRATVLLVTLPGGIHGIVGTLQFLFSNDVQGLGNFALIALLLIAFAYVTFAGLLFWRRPSQVRPLLWGLAIQIPWVSLPGFVYKFALGLYAPLAGMVNHKADTYSAGFHTEWGLGSFWELRLLQYLHC